MTGSWGFESIPVKELEAFDESLLSQTLLRVGTETGTGTLQKTWGRERQRSRT